MPSRENEFPQGVNPTPRDRPPDPRSVPAANQGGADSAEDPRRKRATDEEEQTVRRDIDREGATRTRDNG